MDILQLTPRMEPSLYKDILVHLANIIDLPATLAVLCRLSKILSRDLYACVVS